MKKGGGALDEDSADTALSLLEQRIASQEEDVVRQHGDLVRLLCTVPADELLGLSMGVLAGAARRRRITSAMPCARGEQPWEPDADSLLLQTWLLQSLSSADDLSGVVRGLAAFRIAKECSQRLTDDARHGARESVARDLLSSVTKTIADAREYAWYLGEDEDVNEPAEVKELRASLLDDERLGGFVELSAGRPTIERMECAGRLIRRKPPYALVTILKIFDSRAGMAEEPGEPGDDPTVVVLREDCVQGLASVREGERVRLRLESGLAGSVLTPAGADEHPQSSGEASGRLGQAGE